VEVCIGEWVDTPMPVSCSFLRPNADRKEEMKYTFGIIRLKEGHVIPVTELIAKRKYCKWHDSYSHTTNECN
jgi:hypothetical protein